ncbi:MAG: hypothetical protein WCA22_16365 [Candidatus Binatus sp.]
MPEPVTAIKTTATLREYLATLQELWKYVRQLRNTIEQVADLQARVSTLEKQLERCPSEGCPHCHELAFEVASSEQDSGPIIERQMKCQRCGFKELWFFNPLSGKSNRG